VRDWDQPVTAPDAAALRLHGCFTRAAAALLEKLKREY
jgi:hypothetical protein